MAAGLLKTSTTLLNVCLSVLLPAVRSVTRAEGLERSGLLVLFNPRLRMARHSVKSALKAAKAAAGGGANSRPEGELEDALPCVTDFGLMDTGMARVKSLRHCDTCNKYFSKVSTCGRCGVRNYCSREWPTGRAATRRNAHCWRPRLLPPPSQRRRQRRQKARCLRALQAARTAARPVTATAAQHCRSRLGPPAVFPHRPHPSPPQLPQPEGMLPAAAAAALAAVARRQ